MHRPSCIRFFCFFRVALHVRQMHYQILRYFLAIYLHNIFSNNFLNRIFNQKPSGFTGFRFRQRISLAFDQTCVRQRSNHAPEQGAGQHNYKPSRRATGLFTCPLLSWLRISKRTGWGLRKKSTATAWQPVTLHVSDMGFGEREVGAEKRRWRPRARRGVGYGGFLTCVGRRRVGFAAPPPATVMGSCFDRARDRLSGTRVKIRVLLHTWTLQLLGSVHSKTDASPEPRSPNPERHVISSARTFHHPSSPTTVLVLLMGGGEAGFNCDRHSRVTGFCARTDGRGSGTQPLMAAVCSASLPLDAGCCRAERGRGAGCKEEEEEVVRTSRAPN
jgi:hypothetical protein